MKQTAAPPVLLAAWLTLGALGCTDNSAATKLVTTELATGQYQSLQWGGTQVERFHVVARPVDNPTQAVLVSPQHTEPCSLGDSVAITQTFQPLRGGKWVLGSPSPARIRLFDVLNASNFGTMTFADIDCQRTDLEVPDVSTYNRPIYTPDQTTLRLAATTEDATLLLVDPWGGEVQEVAHNVSAILNTDTAAWLIEGGQIVKRDLEGNELFRKGDKVTELDLLGVANDRAYVDASGLHTVRQGKDKLLAADGCELHPLDGLLAGTLAYFAPCDASQLVITTADGKTFDYGKTVDANYNAQDGRLFFTTHSDSGMTLWVVSAANPGKAEVLTELPVSALQGLSVIRPGVLMLQLQLPDRSVTLMKLELARAEDGPTVVAEGLSSASARGTALLMVTPDRTVTLHDRDGSHLQLRAEKVRYAAYVFNDKSSALGYISDTDPDTRLGRLQLHFINGDHFIIADDVREFQEVWWPERGILYAVGGDKPGIRFTAVDVPCESTSDTAWACGF